MLEPTSTLRNYHGTPIARFNYKLILKHIKPYKTYLVLVIWTMLLSSVFSLILPLFTQSLVDIGISEGNKGFVLTMLIAQVFLAFGQMINDFLRSWTNMHISTRLNLSLVSKFLSKLMRLPLSFIDKKHFGDIMQRIKDTNRIQYFLTDTIMSFIIAIISFCVYCVIITSYNIRILIAFVIGSLLYIFWVSSFLKMRKSLDYEYFHISASNQNNMLEIIGGLQEIKLNVCEKQKRWRWEQIQSQLYHISIKNLSLKQIQQIGSVFIEQSKKMIISFIAANSVITGEMTLGMMMALQYILGQLNAPVMQIMSFIQETQDAIISLERVNDIYSEDDETPDTLNRSSYIDKNSEIEIKRLFFKYSKKEPYVLNDLNLKNCDFGNVVSNLNTTGTVLETNGDNISIINCRLSNGKNIVRSFSSMNTLIKNSLLYNSRNFLLSIGTNEYITIDENEKFDFYDLEGNKVNDSLKNFYEVDGVGDEVLNSYIGGTFSDKTLMKKSLNSIQASMNREELVLDQFKGSMTVEDTLFYRSGIASISLDSMFNGPFLNYSVPSSIDTILKMLSTNDGTTLDKLKFSHISGMSYPVELTLKGKTEFYDYKTSSTLDISGLIEENISSFAASIKPDYAGVIDIDKIFPIKVYLMNEAKNKKLTYLDSYVNVPIAYYGGGVNASKINYDELLCKDNIGELLTIDFIDKYLSLGTSDNIITTLKNMMLKSVTVVSGYEPFKFVCMKGNGYLFDQTPNVRDLIENAKGEQ